jgi:hypothetical protein
MTFSPASVTGSPRGSTLGSFRKSKRYSPVRCTAFSSLTRYPEGDLRTHRECVEPGTGISAVGRADLLGDIAVQVVEHETYVAIDTPVQTRRVDCLQPTGHAIYGPQLVVQIDGVDAVGNLPGAPSAAPQRKQTCRDDAAIGGSRGNIG